VGRLSRAYSYDAAGRFWEKQAPTKIKVCTILPRIQGPHKFKDAVKDFEGIKTRKPLKKIRKINFITAC
jgi:hypothetical protein